MSKIPNGEKIITNVSNQKVAKLPKSVLFPQTCRLRMTHDGFFTEEQHFTLSCAQPHNFCTTQLRVLEITHGNKTLGKPDHSCRGYAILH